MPATDAVGPPMRGGPTLRRVTPVPLIAPRFAPGGVTIGLAIGWLGTSGLASGRAETFPGPSGVVAEGRWGTAVGKCVPSRGCAGAGTATPIELRTGVCGGGDSRRVSAGTPGARDAGLFSPGLFFLSKTRRTGSTWILVSPASFPLWTDGAASFAGSLPPAEPACGFLPSPPDEG